MDITATIAELKKDPAFTANVGMILTHNGVVRGWARGSRETVTSIEVSPDLERIDELQREYEKKRVVFYFDLPRCNGRHQFFRMTSNQRRYFRPATSRFGGA